MKISKVPTGFSFMGKFGYLVALCGSVVLLNIFLAASSHTIQVGYAALFLLLTLLGIALVGLDPYARVAKWRLLMDIGYLTRSKRGRIGSFLFVFGIFFLATRTEGLQMYPPIEHWWPYLLLSTISLVVGAALVLAD